MAARFLLKVWCQQSIHPSCWLLWGGQTYSDNSGWSVKRKHGLQMYKLNKWLMREANILLFSEYKHPKGFLWEKYLEETGTQAAPARAFKPVWVPHRRVLITGTNAVGMKSSFNLVCVLSDPFMASRLGWKWKQLIRGTPCSSVLQL